MEHEAKISYPKNRTFGLVNLWKVVINSTIGTSEVLTELAGCKCFRFSNRGDVE